MKKYTPEEARQRKLDYYRRQYYANLAESRQYNREIRGSELQKIYRDTWQKNNPESYKKSERQRRLKNPEKFRAKTNAKRWLMRRTKNGTIVRPSKCQDCGATGVRILGIQPDYLKPDQILWLCDRCNGKRQRKPL